MPALAGALPSVAIHPLLFRAAEARAMPTIRLLNITPAVVADLADQARFERAYEVRLGDAGPLVREVATQHEAFRRTTGAPPRWGGYLAADALDRLVLGTCGFKGAPDASGTVEIAYFTFPRFEGRGYATAMAAALLREAAPDVRVVRAHTRPEENTSVRLLRRLGFAFRGPVEDPDDGTVWRWEKAGRS